MNWFKKKPKHKQIEAPTTNQGKLNRILDHYIEEGCAEGSYIVLAEVSLRHFEHTPIFRTPYTIIKSFTEFIGDHHAYQNELSITIIIDNSLADSIIEVVSSDQRRTTIEFRDEPPPPNCNSGYSLFTR